ncbi:MAG TPA: hypothetical protein PKO33_18175 [Pyrinomonadaceae bacterium]|nr:hypothetical protein [Pyrinomonadaceae bacterium]
MQIENRKSRDSDLRIPRFFVPIAALRNDLSVAEDEESAAADLELAPGRRTPEEMPEERTAPDPFPGRAVAVRDYVLDARPGIRKRPEEFGSVMPDLLAPDRRLAGRDLEVDRVISVARDDRVEIAALERFDP